MNSLWFRYLVFYWNDPRSSLSVKCFGCCFMMFPCWIPTSLWPLQFLLQVVVFPVRSFCFPPAVDSKRSSGLAPGLLILIALFWADWFHRALLTTGVELRLQLLQQKQPEDFFFCQGLRSSDFCRTSLADGERTLFYLVGSSVVLLLTLPSEQKLVLLSDSPPAINQSFFL